MQGGGRIRASARRVKGTKQESFPKTQAADCSGRRKLLTEKKTVETVSLDLLISVTL